nr:hypothetical protein EATA8330_00550 [Enterobacter asburiae]
MDIALFPGQNARAWAETMINLEARKLINTANIVGGQHLSDGLARIKFMDDIRQFVMQQFSATRAARSHEECMECLKNIRTENESLLDQSRMLRSRTAQLFAQIELVKENNKVVGYVISSIKAFRITDCCRCRCNDDNEPSGCACRSDSDYGWCKCHFKRN